MTSVKELISKLRGTFAWSQPQTILFGHIHTNGKKIKYKTLV